MKQQQVGLQRANQQRKLDDSGKGEATASSILNSVQPKLQRAKPARYSTMTRLADHRARKAYMYVTLRQMWKREKPTSAICVQNVNVQCVCNSH
jgi:hypothetical protein